MICRMNRTNRAWLGFTLIELLIVVAIIGILAAIAVPNFLNAQMRAKIARVIADQKAVQSALEQYFIDWNSSPSITAQSVTKPISSLGTSIPTTDRPGTGASTRRDGAAKAKDKSSARLAIWLTRTLCCRRWPSDRVRSVKPGAMPNWVTAGPRRTSTTWTGKPN